MQKIESSYESRQLFEHVEKGGMCHRFGEAGARRSKKIAIFERIIATRSDCYDARNERQQRGSPTED